MRAFRFLLPLAIFSGAALAVDLDAYAGIGDLLGTKPGDLANPGFNDADTCSNCHGGGVMGDKTFLPGDTWAGTMMANAARDPVFFAGLAVANQDDSGVGSYCLHCHSPIAFVKGNATPPDGSAFDAVDKQGVGCETCHRALSTSVTADPYVISDAQLFYDQNTQKHGPYPACDNAGMPDDCAASPAHEVVQAPTIASASFCGQCHQVTNPDRQLRDATGILITPAVEFPLDTTYEEWKNSAYADGGASPQTCQDCHMVTKSGDFPVAAIFGSKKRHDAKEHGFVGGNHWGIQAVMAANPDRATMLPNQFQLALDRTLANLQAAVVLTLESAPATSTAGASVDVKIKLENKTGHKFPTGYAESRQAWIGIALVDDAMNETMLLGGYDMTTGEIAASPATHLYKSQQGSWDGTKAVAESHLVLHDMILSDTRIPPAGFKSTLTTKPSSEIDYTDGQGGYKSFDEATFTVTIPASAVGKQRIEARVYYQSMTREYAEFLQTANTTNDKGSALHTIYEATGQAAPLLIATASSDIDLGGVVTTSTAGGAGGSGVGGSTGTGGSGSSKSKDSGCGCEVASRQEGSRIPWMIGAFALVAGARRTKRHSEHAPKKRGAQLPQRGARHRSD